MLQLCPIQPRTGERKSVRPIIGFVVDLPLHPRCLGPHQPFDGFMHGTTTSGCTSHERGDFLQFRYRICDGDTQATRQKNRQIRRSSPMAQT